MRAAASAAPSPTLRLSIPLPLMVAAFCTSVGRVLLETLAAMAPEYPRPALDVPSLKARLMTPPKLRAVK